MSKNILSQEEIEKFPHSFYSHAEAILHLSEVGIDIKQTRVADWLDVSRANVSQVVGRMQNSGLIEFKDDLKLTPKGLYLAQIISRRHRITERFLSEVLNLTWDKVYEETRKWENVLSPVTEKAMLEILGNPTTCPFGNPIPHSGYKASDMMNLLEVEANRRYSIEKITEELKKDNEMIQFLQDQEIIPGTIINVLDSNNFSITVSTNNDKYFGLDQFIAERVYVS
tara:strand:- start:443 stop:1120 length:678 start_codon:yes stop_codon:yes gene_type:complete